MHKLEKEEMLENILLDIENGVKSNIASTTLAQKYGISERHLRKLFKSRFNHSLGGYIRSRKLNASINDLLNTNSKEIIIAAEYGFEHESSYIRAFKNEFGVTPGQVRKSGISVMEKPPIQVFARKSKFVSEKKEPNAQNRQLISNKNIPYVRKSTFFRLPKSVNVFGGFVSAMRGLNGGIKMKAKNWIFASVLAMVVGFVIISITMNNNGAEETGLNVTATGTTEGILISFNNIPEDTYSLLVQIFETTPFDLINDLRSTNLYLYKDSLNELKQTGNLLCPFVKNGHEYTIIVTRATFNDLENKFEASNGFENYLINAVAGGGIYLTNAPSLNFTDNNTTVTLSEMPVFSDEVNYSPNGLFQFANFIVMENGDHYGGGMSYWDKLIYPAREVLSDTQEHFGFTGNFPVNATVHSLLVYNNYEWAVAVANAQEKAIMTF